MEVMIRRLDSEIPLPSYQTQDSVGMDLHAAVKEPVVVDPGKIAAIPCGFQMAVPPGYEAQIRPRSGLAAKEGISIPNAPGTIDPDYRGEVKVLLINHGAKPFTVTRGMRIAQMLIVPVPKVTWREVTELPSTARGAGGFGHTGS
jgi:dUTP pyrophosphatase